MIEPKKVVNKFTKSKFHKEYNSVQAKESSVYAHDSNTDKQSEMEYSLMEKRMSKISLDVESSRDRYTSPFF